MSARRRRVPKAGAYSLAKPIACGSVILDTHKRKWIVGMPVAQGGFGCIYSAKLSGENRDNFVAKIEPQENGPLFTEIHFYLRACTQDSISKWKSQHGLSFLGIPRYVSSGLFTPPGQTPCRFLLMDRYTSDFESVLKQGKIKRTNVIKAAYNVLNALEYLHSKDYAHADIKAANLLYTNCFEEVTLVDFGLVHLFRVNGVHCSAKPDVKFKHNGTLEFCSRDAHSGLPPSRRGDLEILLYNIIHWLARCQPGAAQSHSTGLPWGHLIADPKLRAEVPDRVRVQVATLKEQAMQNVECMFSNVGLQPNPDFTRFMLTIKQLGYDETPNYQQLRHYLLAFHKQLTLDVVKTKHAVSVISSKRSVTGHTSEVNSGPSSTKIGAIDINNRNVKSTASELLMPTKRPRGRLQGTKNSGHRKESTTVTDGGVVDSVEKPPKVTNKESVTARTNATGRQTPTSAVPPAINSNKPLSGLKRTPLTVHPTRASPRLIAANSPVPKTVPTCPRTSLSDLFWDSEDSDDLARHDSQIKSQKPVLVREPSGRKVLTPLNPTPDRLIANSPSNNNRKNTLSGDVRRRSGFCQTSPELLLLARSEALQRRALDRAHNLYIG